MNINLRSFTILLFFLFTLSFSCNTNPYSKGKLLYTTYCSPCHMDDGSGLASLIPPIANSDFHRNNQDRLTCIILNGLSDTIIVNGVKFSQKMEGLKMSPLQVTNLTNYINTAWGNNINPKTLAEVEAEWIKCVQ